MCRRPQDMGEQMITLTTMVSALWFDEVWMIEVDTYRGDFGYTPGGSNNPSCPAADWDEDRHQFCLAFEAVERRSTRLNERGNKGWLKRVKVTLNEAAARYCCGNIGALFVFSDVWADNGQQGFIRTSERVFDEVKAAFPEMVATEQKREHEMHARARESMRERGGI